MIPVHFTEGDVAVFKRERHIHPHPRVQVKMEVMWLKSLGYKHNKVAEAASVSPKTVTRIIKSYNEGGLEKLREINFHKHKSKLIDHKGSIEAYFRDYPPSSISEAVNKIEEITGIKRSPTQVRKFLKSIGLRYLKVGVVPSKANPQEQETFKDNELMPRLEEAKCGKRQVFFVDAAHFVYGAFLGFLWCFCRVFIKSPAGRKRFNVLGALNAVSHQLITVTNTTYINALSVCDLMRQIAVQYVRIPITLVLDNARYQKCALVQELAKSLNIELLYLPSYSPNLNLIERLWKFVKKKCLYSKYYSDYNRFEVAIQDCLDSTHTKHKKELETLLTLKFQSFTEDQLMAA
ncbi:MAG: IS630 family transposase [Deltaproteobacteria bacterium]|nr:IS630 family transposase [Deltaproteobacteria bacterium]